LEADLDGLHAVLRKIEFAKPLVYDEAVSRTVITTITVENGSGTFSIDSRVDSSSDESTHVHGEYRLQSTLETLNKFACSLPVITRRTTAVMRPSSDRLPEVFSTRTAYEVIFPRVVEYAKEYHTMQSLTVDASGMEGCADVRLPSDYDRSRFVVHPVFTDTLLHVAGFVANLFGKINDAYICSEVGTVKMIPQLIKNDSSYTVYCNNAWLPGGDGMLAESYAVENAEPRRIVAHLKGMHFRRVRLDRFKKGLAHASGKSLPPRPEHSSVPASLAEDGILRHAPISSSGFSRDVSGDIVKIVSETCDLSVSTLDVNTDLASLGVDSLMSIEIFSKLEYTFPNINLDVRSLSYCKSVADIIQEVSAALDGTSSSPQSSVPSSPRTLVMDDTLLEHGKPNVKRVLAFALELDVHDIEDDLELESLGLDSLTSIETLHALKNEFGLDLPGNFFATFSTVRAVQSYFSSQGLAGEKIEPLSEPRTIVAEGKQMESSYLIRALRLDVNLVPIQVSNSGRTPVFLVHDGSGLIHYYDRLSQLDRPIWGINNPRFIAAEPWESIVHMAKAYADIVANQAVGPIILGGEFSRLQETIHDLISKHKAGPSEE
jgi:iterative type I PKS product template protein